jgi:hypothetical protein
MVIATKNGETHRFHSPDFQDLKSLLAASKHRELDEY